MGQEPILGFESRVSETSTVQPVLPWGAMPGMGVGVGVLPGGFASHVSPWVGFGPPPPPFR